MEDFLAASASKVPGIILAVLAGIAWILSVVVVFPAWLRKRRARRQARSEAARYRPARRPGRPEPMDLVRGEDAVSGALRWLLVETQADAVAHVQLSPSGEERLWVEPRGLDPATISDLARRAREILVSPEGAGETGDAGTRWLGSGGSKSIFVAGVVPSLADEPLRFARSLIEWVRALETVEAGVLEARVREIEGVAWAEVVETDPPAMRVLPTDRANRDTVRAAVEAIVTSSGLGVELVEGAPARVPEAVRPAGEPVSVSRREDTDLVEVRVAGAEPSKEPRLQIVEVTADANNKTTAEVRLTWKGLELRGRGHGRPSREGRYYAAAQAAADALRPLLDTDIRVEALYTASTPGDVDVLVAEVVMEGRRFVGAVEDRPSEDYMSGARAVLDAVNRRVTQIAGRSGRI